MFKANRHIFLVLVQPGLRSESPSQIKTKQDVSAVAFVSVSFTWGDSTGLSISVILPLKYLSLLEEQKLPGQMPPR